MSERNFGIFGVFSDAGNRKDFSGRFVWDSSTGQLGGILHDYALSFINGSFVPDVDLRFVKRYDGGRNRNPITYQFNKEGNLWVGNYNFMGREREEGGWAKALLLDLAELGSNLPVLPGSFRPPRPAVHGSWFEDGLIEREG